MKIDIVTFCPEEDIIAIYVDGKLYMFGDSYHDKMKQFVDGFIDGINLVSSNIEIKRYELIEKSSERFIENGACDFPSRFPFKNYKYIEIEKG